jgi:hypothetical protein
MKKIRSEPGQEQGGERTKLRRPADRDAGEKSRREWKGGNFQCARPKISAEEVIVSGSAFPPRVLPEALCILEVGLRRTARKVR